MKGKQLKYSKSTMKNREQLGSKVSGQSFSEHLQKASEEPLSKRFDEKHLGNGYVDLVPKKKSK